MVLRTIVVSLLALAVAAPRGMAEIILTASSSSSSNADPYEDRNLPKLAVGGRPSHKVQIELHYMPQCPGCRQLISTSFTEAFHTPGFSDMADVDFVPWGKKHRDTSHGVAHHDRVFDNVLESCALQTIGQDHQDLQFAYIDCIDHTGAFEKDPSKVDRSCAKIIGLSPSQTKAIEECAVSEEGRALAEANLQRSESIGMTHAPWIVVNGHKNDAIEDAVWASLFEYVCELYAGPYRSKACPEAAAESPDLMAEQL